MSLIERIHIVSAHYFGKVGGGMQIVADLTLQSRRSHLNLALQCCDNPFKFSNPRSKLRLDLFVMRIAPWSPRVHPRPNFTHYLVDGRDQNNVVGDLEGASCRLKHNEVCSPRSVNETYIVVLPSSILKIRHIIVGNSMMRSALRLHVNDKG